MQTKFEKLNLIAEVEKNMKYIDSLDNELGIKKQASDKSNLDLVKETLEAAYALKKLNKIAESQELALVAVSIADEANVECADLFAQYGVKK